MLTKTDFDLTNYNSYKIKSKCSKAYFPQTESDLEGLFADKTKQKIVIGGGYNIILSKNYYDEEFVIFNGSFSDVVVDRNYITAYSGISMYDLSNIALDKSLTGLEVFYDIPSSLGGAVVMNAGAGGEEIKDLLVSVKYFDPTTLTYSTKTHNEINFEYRNSFFQKNPHLIITKVVLELKNGVSNEIKAKMERLKEARWSKQPKEFPNAGSVFKRPKGHYVGPMIEQLGLKGFSVGGAKISEKHAGFIINYNNATGGDILGLISLVKQKVLQEFNVELEVEQRVL